jgi:hypothetical protein
MWVFGHNLLLSFVVNEFFTECMIWCTLSWHSWKLKTNLDCHNLIYNIYIGVVPFNFITFFKSHWNINLRVMRVRSRCISKNNSEGHSHFSSCNVAAFCMKYDDKHSTLLGCHSTDWYTGTNVLEEFAASIFKAVNHSHSSWTTLKMEPAGFL